MADKLSFMKFISYILNVCLCDPTSNNYVMVLQYANQGNLREYLKINFKPNDKIRHAKNILVHNGTLMIANLGLAKELTTDGSSNSAVYGIPAYVKPQCYKYGDYVKMQSLISIVWVFSYGK
ncbi:hypothetical protein RhiirC2_779057 [Rhizophagus irregularis]|uniref:Uncharacterized protein n=1 Tax=Rhizophagus irregularis TaxID=588596 RepID=A0A2N1NAM0_9GLOM|nr:hypothetical protein RhiirC2_779057 [Rhizophagus irregularis]